MLSQELRHAAITLLLCAVPCLLAEPASRFKPLGTSIGIGGVGDSLVGPGPTKPRYYIDYTYVNATLDLVSIDPDTGAVQVFPNPVFTEWSPKTMVVGPDGNLYLGTAPNAHLLRLETASGKFTDLGRPSSTEGYIWQTAVGTDGKIYGCTYPSAKLVRYDPTTGISEDLGSMDPVQLYARYLAASADGFLYIGIGLNAAHLVAYEISTGAHRDILPAEYHVAGVFPYIRPGNDGKVYASMNGQNFRLEGFTITAITATTAAAAPAPPRNVFADGRSISVSNLTVQVADTHGKVTTFPYTYAGHPLPIFRAGLGPDSMLYASTAMPFNLIGADPALGSPSILNQLGGGEAYSLVGNAGRLLIAAYAGNAPLMSLDPTRPMISGGSNPNPVLVNYQGADNSWRPQSMIAAQDGKIYIGAVAGYGKLNGPLTVWDPGTNHVAQYFLYDDQSVVSVAASGGVIVGGTSISGGGGSFPTATQARLFIWDPASSIKTFETIPVPTASTIANLISVGGMIYGAAGNTFFAFDPQARQVTSSSKLSFTPLSSCMRLAPDGNLWGLTSTGVFEIDLKTMAASQVAASPQSVSAGMDIDASNIYFGSGSTLYSYQWAPLRVVNAASGRPILAPDSIASIFADTIPPGVNAVTIHDAAGQDYTAAVLYSIAGQVSFLVPSAAAPGFGQVTVAGMTSPIEIRLVAPGIFATEPQSGYLMLYGTGIRHRGDLSQIVVQFGNVTALVLYAGPQGQYEGLDQLNVQLPPDLSGPITLRLWVQGISANVVSLILP